MIAQLKNKTRQPLESIHTIDEEGFDAASVMSGVQFDENQSIYGENENDCNFELQGFSPSRPYKFQKE